MVNNIKIMVWKQKKIYVKMAWHYLNSCPLIITVLYISWAISIYAVCMILESIHDNTSMMPVEISGADCCNCKHH